MAAQRSFRACVSRFSGGLRRAWPPASRRGITSTCLCWSWNHRSNEGKKPLL